MKTMKRSRVFFSPSASSHELYSFFFRKRKVPEGNDSSQTPKKRPNLFTYV